MSYSWPGGIISATPTTTVGGEDGSASGMWTLAEVNNKIKNDTWPAIGGVNIGAVTATSIGYSNSKVAKLTSTSFIHVYDDNTNLRARILSRASGSYTVSANSSTIINANTYSAIPVSILVMSSTTVVAVFETTNGIYASVLSISGTTITAGAYTRLFAPDTVSHNLYGSAVLDSTKFILVGNNSWTQQLVVKAIGISGTSLSVLASRGGSSGDPILEANPGYGYTGYAESSSCCSIDSSNVGFIVRTNAAGRLVVFNYTSGSGLTIAQNTTFNSGYPIHNGIVMLTSTKGWITWNGYGENTQYQAGPVYMRPITFNGSTFSMGSTITWANNSPKIYNHTTGYPNPIVKISSTKIGIGLPLTTPSNYGIHYILSPNSNDTSLTTGTNSSSSGWFSDGQYDTLHGSLDSKTYWAQKNDYIYLAIRS